MLPASIHKPLSLVLLVVLASSCSKDMNTDSFLGEDDYTPQNRDLMTIQPEDVPSSDTLFCLYEVFETLPHHNYSTYGVGTGMYITFPCEQPCTDTIEHYIYQHEPSNSRWLWDKAKMVALDDSCTQHESLLNAVWNDRIKQWVIASMPWQ